MLSLPLAGELPLEIPLYGGDMGADLRRVGRGRVRGGGTGGPSAPREKPRFLWGGAALRRPTRVRRRGGVRSTCESCYALKGNYRHKKVQERLEVRRQGLFSKDWTPAMTFLVNYFSDQYFRWFDSGDILCGAPHN